MFVWPVIALVGILSAVWFFGVRRRGTVGDAAAVQRLIGEAFPEFAPAEIAFDPDGTTALAIDGARNEVILLFTMGNQVALRLLDPDGIRGIDVSDAADGGKRIVVHLHDLGCPRLAFTLTAADAPCWTARLERLARPSVEGSMAPAMSRDSGSR